MTLRVGLLGARQVPPAARPDDDVVAYLKERRAPALQKVPADDRIKAGNMALADKQYGDASEDFHNAMAGRVGQQVTKGALLSPRRTGRADFPHAPGSAGLYQIAVQLPSNVPTGAVALLASIGGVISPTGVLLYVAAQ